MGIHRLYEMKYFCTFGTLKEYECLKATALNLWEAPPFPLIGRFPASRPPDRLSLSKMSISHFMTVSLGRGMGSGAIPLDGRRSNTFGYFDEPQAIALGLNKKGEQR